MKKLVLLFAAACAILYGAAVNGWLDLPVMAAPSAPSAGAARLFINSATGKLDCLASGGADCMPATATAAASNCELVIGDPGAASPVLATDNAGLFQCLNTSAASYTITAVKCRANSGGATAVNPIFTGGASNSILSAPLTCPAGAWGTGTLNGAPAQAVNGSLDLIIAAADGITKQIVVVITRQ
jgi:hypothetical protein